jgi:hypothetical protein
VKKEWGGNRPFVSEPDAVRPNLNTAWEIQDGPAIAEEDFEEFVREKRAAAVRFDAELDVGYRPITRQKMQEAEQVLAAEVTRETYQVPWRSSGGVLLRWATRRLVTGSSAGYTGTIGTCVTRRTDRPQ